MGYRRQPGPGGIGRALAGIVVVGLASGWAQAQPETQAPVRLVVRLEAAGAAATGQQHQALALADSLQSRGCPARVAVASTVGEADLVFDPAQWDAASPPPLVALNREGSLPVPVWVTRKNAGVRSLKELRGRELATLPETDPVGFARPLQALESQGVSWRDDQLYKASSYSSALGLLLHNNAHASASELGLARHYQAGNDLVLTWIGEPLAAGAWHLAGQGDPTGAVIACLDALASLDRGGSDRQAFALFPEWVERFSAPEPAGSGQDSASPQSPLQQESSR